MTKQEHGFKRAWKYLRPLAVGMLSLSLVVVGITMAIRYVLSHFIEPVDVEDNTPIEVVIPSGSSASKIASILYNARGEDEEGLIVSTASFKVYVDFVGKANSLKAGTYIFSRNMSISQIVEMLCQGNEARSTVRFTIPEGYTVEAIANVLKEGGIIEDAEEFLTLCKDGGMYKNYSFIEALEEDSARRYALEGYLFPDTYEVYKGSSCDEIIIKMLDRFAEVYADVYAERAAELGMTTDEVVTLASMIEKEAAADGDFAKVSAVFHNRLNKDMALESCATLSYVLGVQKLTFEQSEMDTVSPYNTYKNKGLPVGAICNPGRAAIEAALYPEEAYVIDNFLYFCNGNIQESNALLFSKTYEEHKQKVDQYSQYWK